MLLIRNVAIIAHVDHGKTTLIDSMLKQSGIFRENQNISERAMDSNDLEKERGITMLAKCTAINWKEVKINIIDTPGHADFGGEVERILNMVDGVILLVDSSEGSMPQTKFVLSKALKIGLKPIVVINKIDKQDARVSEVIDEILDLFISLDATNEQIDFPIIYASGRDGWATLDMKQGKGTDLTPLFDMIITYIDEPVVDQDAPFTMLATLRAHNSYLGRVLTGRINSGVAKVKDNVKSLDMNGNLVETARITKIFTFHGLQQVSVDEARAGDIVVIAGMANTNISNTICDPSISQPLPSQPIDPSTISINMSINDSPLAGLEGNKLTSNILRDRLNKEAQDNVAIKITESENRDSFEVAGRGELQIGVLVETMRREGFELSVDRPKVIMQTDADGNKLEPYEEVQIDLDTEFVGVVVESMNERKAKMLDMRSTGDTTRLLFIAPSRGLIGYHGQFLTETRGTGVINRIFHSYDQYCGKILGRRNGVLISNASGVSVAYALWGLRDRGDMFIDAGVNVYEGMIIGEHNRDNDLEVNVLKAKQLTNIRSVTKDEAIRMPPPRGMSIEYAITYIQDDERVEITPKSIRLRKKLLSHNDRKRAKKTS